MQEGFKNAQILQPENLFCFVTFLKNYWVFSLLTSSNSSFNLLAGS